MVKPERRCTGFPGQQEGSMSALLKLCVLRGTTNLQQQGEAQEEALHLSHDYTVRSSEEP
jgi:hypothetical protein